MSEMSCTRLAGNTRRKKSPFWHHCTTLSVYIFGTTACIDNWKKNLLNSNTSSTWLQRQSVIATYCGWADRDQVLIDARRSVQCVVRGFLETSALKPHRYISRYREIFEKESRHIDRKKYGTSVKPWLWCAIKCFMSQRVIYILQGWQHCRCHYTAGVQWSATETVHLQRMDFRHCTAEMVLNEMVASL